LDGWRAHLSKQKFETVDVSNAIAFVMAVREESEINTVKKACQVRRGRDSSLKNEEQFQKNGESVVRDFVK